jgi:hypothetical protein
MLQVSMPHEAHVAWSERQGFFVEWPEQRAAAWGELGPCGLDLPHDRPARLAHALG